MTTITNDVITNLVIGDANSVIVDSPLSGNGTTGSHIVMQQKAFLSVINAATPAALAAVDTLTSGANLATGQPALVNAMRVGGGEGTYTLQLAISTTPDSYFIIATADDVTRQWVHSSIIEQGLPSIISNEIDFTVSPQTIVLFPPIGYRFINLFNMSAFLTAKDGTVTVGPTVQAGTDSATVPVNIVASTVQATLAAAALNTNTVLSGATLAQGGLSLSSNGIVFHVSNPATLGTATVFKGRICLPFQLSKF